MSRQNQLRLLPTPTPPRRSSSPKTHSLHDSRPTGRVRIMAVQLDACRRDTLHRRGLVEGRVIRLLYNDFKGRLAVEVDGNSLILGRRETRRILVRQAPASHAP